MTFLMKKQKNQLISSLPAALTPTQIWDITTGEQITLPEFQNTLDNLITFVKNETIRLYEENKKHLLEELEKYTGTPQPAEWARKHEYNYDPTKLPNQVKQKYRLNKLIQYKLVSETASYVLNPNPKKQEHSFNHTINLGAVDKQMVTLSTDNTSHSLTLQWKCWDKEFLLEFHLPAYVFEKRNVTKWCLPTVNRNGFHFSYIENKQEQKHGKHTHYAGTDYGRVRVYSTIIINQKGNCVAQYNPTGRLRLTNQKRERILKHKKYNTQKLKTYDKLDPNKTNISLNKKRNTLNEENARLSGKAHRLGTTIANQTGAELAQKLAKHSNLTHVTENLKWATGKKYGSRFLHSQLNQATQHALNRKNIPTKTVTAKNNSQTCYKCNSKITHNTKNRTIWCSQCKIRIDRDYNAALNIIKKYKRFPNLLRRIEGSHSQLNPCSHTGEHTTNTRSTSDFKSTTNTT